MSFGKSVNDQSSHFENKDSIIFHEHKGDGENSKKFILKNENAGTSLESSIDKGTQNPTCGMSVEEDMTDFPQINEHNNEDETVTLVYQHDGMALLSAGEDRLVNLVELSSIEGGTNSLDLDAENLEYSGARVILQQDFDNDGEIAVVTTDISESQLELLQSRLQGNEALTLFQGDTNIIDKDKESDSPIANHLIHIPTSEVLDNHSIPLSLISESKGVRVIQNLDRHFLTVEYENGESLLPITLTSEDILASEESTYSSRRNSDLLERNVSDEDLANEENLVKKSAEIKLTPKTQKQGQVGRPKKHLFKTIGSGPNAISSEGVVQEINNRLVTVLPRPEDLKKLLDGRQLITLKANGRAVLKPKISKIKQDSNKFPNMKVDSQTEDDIETSQIYVDLAAAQESKCFWALKSTQQKAKKRHVKGPALVHPSTGRRPGRPRKTQTIMAGPKRPKIIHTGPNNEKCSPMMEDKIIEVESALFNTEDLEADTFKEREFDFFNNEDMLKRKLPPRKRGTRYQKLIEELQKSEEDELVSEEDESPDFLTPKSVTKAKPSMGTGKRGRPRKYPIAENSGISHQNGGGQQYIEDNDIVESNGTSIIQLSENLQPIETTTSTSVLVRDGRESSGKSIQAQDSLTITFDNPLMARNESMVTFDHPTDHVSLGQAKIHIDADTNISLVPQYDALESATIFVKEDGRYEEGFACEYCQGSFEFKRDFLQHLKVKHGDIPLDCSHCGRSFTCASSLRSHQTTHVLENSCCCSICVEGFSTCDDIKDHSVHHSTEIGCQISSGKFAADGSYHSPVTDCSELRCRLCLDTFASKSQLQLHKCQHPDKRYVCDICNANFVSSSGLNRHRKVHTRSNLDLERGLNCIHCMAGFSYQTSLDTHIQCVHGEQVPNGLSVGPAEISQVFSLMETPQGYAPSTAELYDVPKEEEIREQSAVQPFLCGICDSAFSDIDLLCDHFNACHTGDQPHFCKVCSVGCSTETQLTTHKNIHNQEEMKAAEQSVPTEECPFLCKLCHKRFKKKNEMEKHTKLHSEEKKFKCDQCDASFLGKSTLDKHLLVHSGRRPYVCDICYKGFRQVAALVRHKLWTHHRLKNKNKCDICCKSFFSRSLLLFHLDSHGELGKTAKEKILLETVDERAPANTDELICEHCGIECPSVAAFLTHKLSHKGPSALFSCDLCHRSFKEKRKLKKHRLKHRSVKSWACDICNKSFATKLTRIRHSHVHLREALNPIPKLMPGDDTEATDGGCFPYQLFCQECNVQFQHNSHFVRHKLLHAGIPLFKCGICGKMFVHKSDIFRHKVMHSFMFCCEICGKNFHKRSLFLLHKERHRHVRPFKCEHCGKRFATNSGYEVHSRIHSGEKPYKCNMCDYSCAQSGRLMKHRQVHSGVKMYSCETCNKQLSSIESLRIHSRIHTGDRPYKCAECPKSFLNKGGLTAHMKDHFKEETYKCDTCPHKFKKEAHLAKHKLFHQAEQHYIGSSPNEVYVEHLGIPLYMCLVCGRVFNKKKYLYNHHNVHVPSRKFTCSFCSKTLLSKTALRNHMVLHSGEMAHKCRTCSKEFRNLFNLKRHERTHVTEQTFNCDECNATFNEEQSLEDHKQAHLNLIMMDSVNSAVSQHLYVFDSVEETMNDAMNRTQQLLVDNSQQQFIVDGSQSLLVFPDNSNNYSEIAEPQDTPMETPDTENLRVLTPQETEVIQTVTQLEATDERCTMKPHQCDVCFKTFAKRQYLTKHKYRHREIKSHPCDICGKRFAQKFEVAVHKMKHTGDKPYHCDECGKDFRSKANLINHKMKHTGEYPFMCSICNKGLSTQLQLERHVSLHTGTYPYKCSLCQKGFSMRSSLSKHLEKSHIVTLDTQMEESEVDSNLESMQAISSITDTCKPGVKAELADDDDFSVQLQPQLNCLLSETSVIENKFLTSILQQEEPSPSNADVAMADLSDNLN